MTRVQVVKPVATVTPDWRKPVLQVPLTQAFPQFEQVREFRSKVCLFSEDRTKVYDVVSNRYKVVDHGQAVDAVEQALAKYFGPGKAPKFAVRSLNGGARIRGEIKLPMPGVDVGTLKRGDISHFTLLLRNSYDRSCPFTAQLGAVRLVCTNGMTMPAGNFGQISARHVGGLAEGGSIGDGNDAILDQLDNIIKRAPLVREVWQEWQDTKITRDDAMAYVDGWLPAKYATPILDEANWKTGQTKWDFYNTMTHMSTHLTNSMQRRMDFDERISRMFYEGAFDTIDAEAEEA